MQPELNTNKRPLLFLGVGMLNTLLDFSFYTFLTQTIFHDNIVVAGLVSGTFALICAFLTHGLITWRGRKLKATTVLRFFLFTGFGMWVLRPLLLAAFIQLEPVYNFATNLASTIGVPLGYGFVSNTGAFGFMIILVLLYNYFVYDRYVFAHNR